MTALYRAGRGYAVAVTIMAIVLIAGSFGEHNNFDVFFWVSVVWLVIVAVSFALERRAR